jgi:hypothetical protein
VSTTAARPVLWRPHEGPQRRFLASPAYEALYGGAAGGGKSDALLYGALRQVGHPSYRALLLRRTYPELRELMDRSLLTFRQLGAEWNEAGKRWTFPSGATVEFGYAETYKDVLRYQGQEFTYIGWDELGLCAEERMWLFLLTRNRASAPGLILQARGSANPGGPGHAWLKKRFVLPCGIDGARAYTDPATGLSRAYVPARLADNPTLLKNDPAYMRRLMAQPERTRRQLLDGDWDAGDGLALEELTRAQHLVAPFEVPDRWYQWGAFDWGYRHPFSFGHFAADEDGNVYLVNAVHGRGLLPAQIAERVRDTIATDQLRTVVAGHDCWADHKARGERVPTIAEAFAAAGIHLSQGEHLAQGGAQQPAPVSRVARRRGPARRHAGVSADAAPGVPARVRRARAAGVGPGRPGRCAEGGRRPGHGRGRGRRVRHDALRTGGAPAQGARGAGDQRVGVGR